MREHPIEAERGGAPAPPSDTERLRNEAVRVERLLDEVRGMVGPPAWARVEELVQRLIGLYGAGLARLLEHAKRGGTLDERMIAALAADELVSNLLVLHGLHPLEAVKRIERALDEVRPYLGSHAGGVELIGIDAAGTATLRLVGTCQSCPSSRITIEHTIERAVLDAAPEVVRVQVEGVSGEASPPAVKPQWTVLEAVSVPRPGERKMLELGGVRMILLALKDTLVAYRDGCPGCTAKLDAARLEETILTCTQCGRRYDVAHAGRGLDGKGSHLKPIPLLREGSQVRLSLPEEKS